MTQKYCQNTKRTRKDPAARQEPEKESIFGPEKTREQVMEELKSDPETKPERLEEFLVHRCINPEVNSA